MGRGCLRDDAEGPLSVRGQVAQEEDSECLFRRRRTDSEEVAIFIFVEPQADRNPVSGPSAFQFVDE